MLTAGVPLDINISGSLLMFQIAICMAIRIKFNLYTKYSIQGFSKRVFETRSEFSWKKVYSLELALGIALALGSCSHDRGVHLNET